jgi:hypothetical protein
MALSGANDVPPHVSFRERSRRGELMRTRPNCAKRNGVVEYNNECYAALKMHHPLSPPESTGPGHRFANSTSSSASSNISTNANQQTNNYHAPRLLARPPLRSARLSGGADGAAVAILERINTNRPRTAGWLSERQRRRSPTERSIPASSRFSGTLRRLARRHGHAHRRHTADWRTPRRWCCKWRRALLLTSTPATVIPEPAAATPSIRCKRRIRHYPPANVDSC